VTLYNELSMNLKRLMIGTPLERPARIFHRLLTGGPHATSNIECELRDARDNAYVRALLRNKLKRDSNCIDVGAHSGFFLCQFIEFAPEGRHWAFEPIPALAAELKRNFPSVKVHECALSDQEGQTTFQYVPELPGWSGLRAQPYPVRTHRQTIHVELRRFDSLIAQDAPIAFIKINVEGAELEVLRGAAEILRRQNPIVLFECAKIHHSHYDTTSKAIHEFLTRYGMGVFLLDQTGPLTLQAFTDVYEASHRSGYDRTAQSNYLAMPA